MHWHWHWVLGALVFGSIGISLYVMFLTEKNKSSNRLHRLRRRNFRPEWERRDEEKRKSRTIRFRRD